MPISATTLELLMKAGLEGEALLEVVRSVEADTVKKRSGAAERQARYRARQKGRDVTRDATSDASPVTQQPSRVEDNIIKIQGLDIKNKSLSPSLSLSQPASEQFEAFWGVYPKRDGSMDRKGAAKAFGAALKRASLQTIIEGAQHFAQAMTARGKVGTEFIPQPRTWLNGDRWNDRYDNGTAADSKEAQWLAVLQKHAAPARS